MVSKHLDCATIGCLLIEKGLITQEQLEEALQYQKRYGGRLGWILSTLGYVRRLDFFRTLAELFNLPFVEGVPNILEKVDNELVRRFDPEELVSYEVLPARLEGNKVLLFTSYPNSDKLSTFVNKHFPGKVVEQVVVTDLDLVKVLQELFKGAFIDKAVNGLFYLTPEYSASVVFSEGQVFLMGGLLTPVSYTHL
ncbi:MAG: hypothetical protein N3C13_03245, partial [Aquificaceae bacterium]|nr:hypothetical protein [Aquificaceae bacterium]